MMLRPRVITARDAKIIGEREAKIIEGRAEVREDNYVTKIIKYIPAESVAAYLAAYAIIEPSREEISHQTLLWIVAGSLFAFTFLWQLFGASDRREGLPLPFYQAIVSTIAFAVWVFVTSGTDLIGTAWHAVYGSLLALAVTLFGPLLEKAFVRPRPAKGISVGST